MTSSDSTRASQLSGEDFKSGRLNAGKEDINRDFPTWMNVKSSREDLYRDRQPETVTSSCQSPGFCPPTSMTELLLPPILIMTTEMIQ